MTELQTERLLLRVPVQADLDGWSDLMGDGESARFIGGVVPRAAAWRSMAAMTGSWLLKGFGMFSVVEKASGACIGRLGPWEPEDWPGTEVGWGLTRSAWGKGYATEGAAAAIDWAFTTLGWSNVIHCINAQNVASVGVARRLGSVYLCSTKLPAPFEANEVDVWGQSREAWSRNRATVVAGTG